MFWELNLHWLLPDLVTAESNLLWFDSLAVLSLFQIRWELQNLKCFWFSYSEVSRPSYFKLKCWSSVLLYQLQAWVFWSSTLQVQMLIFKSSLSTFRLRRFYLQLVCSSLCSGLLNFKQCFWCLTVVLYKLLQLFCWFRTCDHQHFCSSVQIFCLIFSTSELCLQIFWNSVQNFCCLQIFWVLSSELLLSR